MDIYIYGYDYRLVIRQMKREGFASVAGSVVLVALLLGVSLLGAFRYTEVDNIVNEQPLSWSLLASLCFAVFLGIVVLTYRVLPEPKGSQEGDSYDG